MIPNNTNSNNYPHLITTTSSSGQTIGASKGVDGSGTVWSSGPSKTLKDLAVVVNAGTQVEDVLFVTAEVSKQILEMSDTPALVESIGTNLKAQLNNAKYAYTIKLMEELKIDPNVLANQTDMISRLQTAIHKLRYELALILDSPMEESEIRYRIKSLLK